MEIVNVSIKLLRKMSCMLKNYIYGGYTKP